MPQRGSDNEYNNVEKIIKFNHYVRKIELEHKPDIIIIGLPGEIMPFDEKNFGHFALMPYLISNAVKCDYAILQLFNNCCSTDYVKGIAEMCSQRFMFDIDICCISHNIVDISSTVDPTLRFFYSISSPDNTDPMYFFDYFNEKK